MLIAGIVLLVLGWLGGVPTTERSLTGLASPAPRLAECPPRVPAPPAPMPPRPAADPVVV
jgi:hypothetical protein